MVELNYLNQVPLGGFNYDNCIRNTALETATQVKHKMSFTKTGTTICGAVFNGGVVLAADTRATAGSIVADKNCAKLHPMAPNIYAAGAGTAADCDHVSEMIKRELELHRFNTHSENRVQMAAGRLADHVFKYGGHIGTHMIMGGVDVRGPQLIEISNDGHQKASCFLTMGSGSLSAMAVLETDYREGMTQDEAQALCIKAIEAGIYHDLGSGSNVDVVIIKKGKVEYKRNLKSDNFKMYAKPEGYKYRPDRVHVLEEYRHKIRIAQAEQPMQM